MNSQVLIDYEITVARDGFVVRALVKLEGREPEGSAKAPLNLAVVLDRSGSMSGEKLARAKEAAVLLLRRLRAIDAVGVVAYDGNVSTVGDLSPGADHHALMVRLEGIGTGGSTNLSGGWMRGHEIVRRRRDKSAEGTLHRVLLLTDGQANVGITDPATLVGLCRTAAEKGVTTSTIGFGADYDEVLLRAMADAGGGSTYYIESPDQAPGVLEEEIEGLLTLSAQNVAVEIKQSDSVQLVAIHNDYPATPIPGGMRLDIGDLYAREPRKILLEFFVPGLDARASVAIAEVLVTAYALTAGGGVERQEVRLNVESALGTASVQQPEVRREMMLLEVARAREEALRRRAAGDNFGGGAVLSELAARLAEPWSEYGGIGSELSDDLLMLSERMTTGEFDEADAKYSAQRVYNARRGKDAYEAKLRRKR